MDRQDNHSAVVLLEFPSFRAAQQYCTMTTTFLAAENLAANMAILGMDYFEDVPSADASDSLAAAEHFGADDLPIAS